MGALGQLLLLLLVKLVEEVETLLDEGRRRVHLERAGIAASGGGSLVLLLLLLLLGLVAADSDLLKGLGDLLGNLLHVEMCR